MIWGLLAALAAPAWGSGPEVWAALYNGRLMASADRDQVAAIAVYETLLADLSDGDPLRAELSLWLGLAQLDDGRADAAVESLRDAARLGQADVRLRARRTLADLQLRERAIVSLPFSTTFSDGVGPVVRGWTHGLPGALSVAPGDPADGLVLSWAVDVQAAEDDFVRLELQPTAGPVARVRLRLRSTAFEAQVRVMVEDSQGERWTAPVQAVPAGTWVGIDRSLLDFAPADAPAALRRPDAGQVRAVEIRDVTGYHSIDRGENVLWIDDLDVR